jgi:hypothetical protein
MICEKCQPRELKAMRALESLTPSGSEFVNDVDRCVAFVRAHNATQMSVIVRLTKRVRELEASTPVDASHKKQRQSRLSEKLTGDGLRTYPRLPGCMAYGDTRSEAVVRVCILLEKFEKFEAGVAASQPTTEKEK